LAAVVVIDLFAKELSSSMVRRRDIRSPWDRLFGAILFSSTIVQVIVDWYLFHVVVWEICKKVVASGNANNSILAEQKLKEKVSTKMFVCVVFGLARKRKRPKLLGVQGR